MAIAVKFSEEKPPVWDELVAKFNPDWDWVCVTYGDTIHMKFPKDGVIPQDLITHEIVHVKQQNAEGMTAKLWWAKYLADDSFRKSQEIEAYQYQYRYIKKYEKDRNFVSKQLVRLASDLSGVNYGKLMTFQEAMQAIAS